MRDKLAAELARETGFHASGLSRELRAVLTELDNLPIVGGAEVSRVDQIADGIAV